jgi:spore germination protein KB
MARTGSENDHIRTGQFAVLVAEIVFSTGFMAVGSVIATISESAAWLGTLLGAAGGLIVAWLCGTLVRLYPGMNLPAIADTVLPKALSKLASLSFAAYCTWLLGIGSRQFILAIWIPFLESTSPLTLALVASAIIAYGASLGIEAIARASMVFFPIALLSIVVLAGLSVPVAHPARLLPIIGAGLPELGLTALITSAYGTECIVGLAFVSHLNEPSRAGRSMSWGVLVGMTLMSAVLAVATMLLGSQGVARVMFPAVEAARLVGPGEFLERSEVLLLAIWFSVGLLKQAAVFHATTVSIADALGLRTRTPVFIPLIVASVILSLYPTTVVSVLHSLKLFQRYTPWYALALPALLLTASALRPVPAEGRRRE